MTKLQMMCLAGLALAGCTDEAPPSDGLVLEIDAPDVVAGTFEQNGGKLHFEFSKFGEQHRGELHARDGSHLITSTLEHGRETLDVLDHLVVLEGPVGSPAPNVEGDLTALEELAESVDLALLDELKRRLADRGVDPDLFSPPKPETKISEAYWGSDGYYHMGPGETGRFGTQPFWWPTEVVLKNFSGNCATVKFQAGLGLDTHVVPARGYKFVTGYWWAAWLYITPLNAYVDWSYIGMGVCGPAEVGAFTRYGA